MPGIGSRTNGSISTAERSIGSLATVIPAAGNTARVKTYGEVLEEYEYHPESKCGDANGHASSKQTIGLLQRRHVLIDGVTYIGKESNRLEEVESGAVHDPESAYTEYPDPKRSEWVTKILPAIKDITLAELIRLCLRGQGER